MHVPPPILNAFYVPKLVCTESLTASSNARFLLILNCIFIQRFLRTKDLGSLFCITAQKRSLVQKALYVTSCFLTLSQIRHLGMDL